jgi:hypothetical protein
LYHQLAEYHFKLLQDQFRDANRLLWDQKQARHQFDKTCLKESIHEQTDSLKYMDEEIVDDDNVKGVFRRQPSFRGPRNKLVLL